MIRRKLFVLARLRKYLLLEQKGKSISVAGLLVLLLISFLAFPALSGAELEWKEKKQFTLEGSPLDVVQSDDGRWAFILSSGAVSVYSAAEDRVTQTIPIGTEFDRLSFSGKSNRLILTSSSQNVAKIIQLDLVHRIDVSGLPFKGAESAPVTIAVFSDYQ
jgi:hypothetical protein